MDDATNVILIIFPKGSFKNHVDIILLFFDHPPTSMDIFHVQNVDKNGQIWTKYPHLLVWGLWS